MERDNGGGLIVLLFFIFLIVVSLLAFALAYAEPKAPTVVLSPTTRIEQKGQVINLYAPNGKRLGWGTVDAQGNANLYTNDGQRWGTAKTPHGAHRK